MRRFLSSLITGGGALTLIAFFLPWVTVSCNGTRVMSVSPYERATGSARPDMSQVAPDIDIELGPSAERSAAAKAAIANQAPQSGYWALLLAPIILVAAGLLFHLAAFSASGGPPAIAVAAAIVGIITTAVLGLRDHLGMSVAEGEIPAIVLSIDVDVGAWISLVGYVLAASGGVAAMLLASRVDRPDWR